ncbi:ABC transporter ATP-binding protein [Xylocopilactobacillus apicola]|uniref:ABC transporter ATP-binding protein n=1 Tax=Xylocopilactobacillus apicola TaxID=2932184 RepID=A0AAU9DS03_9LACO|nr:ABC transporter ATP-binding protein [Xylocopilactobacillus apicola]BDR57983.1 ABC transporter ATP-binding protein [Xylocopilactobacillus apicola]
MKFIEVNEMVKEFRTGHSVVRALNDVSFSIDEGTFNVILGPSGSGKTTMLNMIGGMDTLTSGSMNIDGRDVSNLSDAQLTDYRRNYVGFVFQFYNIIPSLNVFENVDLVKNLGGSDFNTKEIIESVGLGDRMYNFPQDLSGGELQRVSIARAICKNPKILLCDEPTGALDTKTGQTVLQILSSMATKYKKTVIVVTHNSKIEAMGDQVIKIKDGNLEDVIQNKNPKKTTEIEW